MSLVKSIQQTGASKYLFKGKFSDTPMQKLVKVIIAMNKKVGLNMSMNEIRHSYISWYIETHPKLSTEDLNTFSKSCYHSMEMT
jgi:hypothetical protein